VRLQRAGLTPVRRCLAAPVVTAFGPIRRRDGLWLRLASRGAGSAVRIGVGEATPLPAYGGETLRRVGADLARLARDLPRTLAGVDPAGEIRGFAPGGAGPLARFALSTALADLRARLLGISLAQAMQRPSHPAPAKSVPVNALLTAWEPPVLAAEAAAAVAHGEHTLKLKIGQGGLAEDLDRLSAVRGAVGFSVALRADANATWDEAEADRRLRAFKPFDLEYVEQPLPAPDLAGLARLRRSSGVRVAADEAAHSGAAVRRLLAAEAVDVLVLKPALLGGVGPARRAAERSARAGVPVVLSSFLDGAVAQAACLQLAAGLLTSLGPGRLLPCGLSPTPGLRGDPVEPFAARAGRIALRAGPGLGIAMRGRRG